MVKYKFLMFIIFTVLTTCKVSYSTSIDETKKGASNYTKGLGVLKGDWLRLSALKKRANKTDCFVDMAKDTVRNHVRQMKRRQAESNETGATAHYSRKYVPSVFSLKGSNGKEFAYQRYQNQPVYQNAYSKVVVGSFFYIVGYDEKHFGPDNPVGFIQKCDLNGTVIWTRFSGVASSFNSICSIGKYVFAVGTSYEGTVVLTKEDTTGSAFTEQEFTFDLTGTNEVGCGIAASGGYLFINGNSSDGTFLLKCTTNGTQIWCQYWNGGYSLSEVIVGNTVFLTGADVTGNDVFLLKYNTINPVQTGTVVYYDGGAIESGYSITYCSNYLYITGGTYSDGSFMKTLLLKYNTNLQLQTGWPKIYDTYESFGRAIVGVTEGTSSFLYISGSINKNNSNTYDVSLLKYNTSGILQSGWPKTYGGTENESAMGMAASGSNLYITGYKNYQNEDGEWDTDVLMLKYVMSSPTSPVWVKDYRGSRRDEGYKIVAYNNYLYTVGYTDNYKKNKQEVAIQKWDLNGNLQWSRQWGDPNDDRSIIGNDLVVYNSNIYVTAVLCGDDGQYKTYLIRYDMRGNYILHANPYESDEENSAHAITVYNNKLYITGQKSGVLFVLQYDPGFSGNSLPEQEFLWDNPNAFFEVGYDLVVDNTGIYITGHQLVDVSELRIVNLKLNLITGVQDWFQTNDLFSVGRALKKYGNDIYITGNCLNSDTSSSGLLVIKMSSMGQEVWRQIYLPMEDESYLGQDITVQGSHMYICAIGPFEEGSVFKYSTSGQLQSGWPVKWGYYDDWGNGVVYTNSSIYTTGRTTCLGLGHTDILLQKYDPAASTSSKPSWSKTWGGQQ